MPIKKGKKVGFVKKVARSASRFVKKRYGVGKKRSLNVGAIARDVASMATMLNAEKKVLSIGAANALAIGQTVGQVNANVSGALAFDLTPMMPQGSGVSDRTGNSIKLHSSYFQFEVRQALANNSATMVRIEMWSNPGIVQDQADLLSRLYVPNPFTGIIDFNSGRNPDHFNDYRKLMTRKCYLPADQISGTITTKQFAVPFSWNRKKGHHVRYTGTGSTNYLTDVKAGQFFIVYFASNGNSNTTTASTLAVPIQPVSTAPLVKMSYRHYYYDN